MIGYYSLDQKLYDELCEMRFHLLSSGIFIPELQDTEKFNKLNVTEFYKIAKIAEKQIVEQRRIRSIDFANICLTIANVNGNKDVELNDFIPWKIEKEEYRKEVLNVNDHHPIDPSAASIMKTSIEKSIAPSWVSHSLPHDRMINCACKLERSPYRFLVSRYAVLYDTFFNDEISPLVCLNINWIHNFPETFDVYDPKTREKVGTLRTLDEWLEFLSVADTELEWI